MHSVVETSIFTRRADALLSTKDRQVLIDRLAFDPQSGDLVPGLAGIRKLRFAPKGRGKSGGLRVVYYLAAADLPVLALLVYAKNEQDDITPDQRKTMLALIEAHRARRPAAWKGAG